MTDLEIIEETLQLGEDDAEIVRQLCDWVEHEVAVARYGYPKDNIVPRPMDERLVDADYVTRLRRVARNEDASDRILEALTAQHDRIAP